MMCEHRILAYRAHSAKKVRDTTLDDKNRTGPTVPTDKIGHTL